MDRNPNQTTFMAPPIAAFNQHQNQHNNHNHNNVQSHSQNSSLSPSSSITSSSSIGQQFQPQYSNPYSSNITTGASVRRYFPSDSLANGLSHLNNYDLDVNSMNTIDENITNNDNNNNNNNNNNNSNNNNNNGNNSLLSYNDEDDNLDDEYEDNLEDDEDDEDEDDIELELLSSSPSIHEDVINFNFVYALHSFSATAEGQASASKGDPLELLDDSNSYWWLVRHPVTRNIGYLPAEHIETPIERLARLNKHKNSAASYYDPLFNSTDNNNNNNNPSNQNSSSTNNNANKSLSQRALQKLQKSHDDFISSSSDLFSSIPPLRTHHGKSKKQSSKPKKSVTFTDPSQFLSYDYEADIETSSDDINSDEEDQYEDEYQQHDQEEEEKQLQHEQPLQQEQQQYLDSDQEITSNQNISNFNSHPNNLDIQSTYSNNWQNSHSSTNPVSNTYSDNSMDSNLNLASRLGFNKSQTPTSNNPHSYKSNLTLAFNNSENSSQRSSNYNTASLSSSSSLSTSSPLVNSSVTAKPDDTNESNLNNPSATKMTSESSKMSNKDESTSLSQPESSKNAISNQTSTEAANTKKRMKRKSSLETLLHSRNRSRSKHDRDSSNASLGSDNSSSSLIATQQQSKQKDSSNTDAQNSNVTDLNNTVNVEEHHRRSSSGSSNTSKRASEMFSRIFGRKEKGNNSKVKRSLSDASSTRTTSNSNSQSSPLKNEQFSSDKSPTTSPNLNKKSSSTFGKNKDDMNDNETSNNANSGSRKNIYKSLVSRNSNSANSSSTNLNKSYQKSAKVSHDDSADDGLIENQVLPPYATPNLAYENSPAIVQSVEFEASKAGNILNNEANSGSTPANNNRASRTQQLSSMVTIEKPLVSSNSYNTPPFNNQIANSHEDPNFFNRNNISSSSLSANNHNANYIIHSSETHESLNPSFIAAVKEDALTDNTKNKETYNSSDLSENPSNIARESENTSFNSYSSNDSEVINHIDNSNHDMFSSAPGDVTGDSIKFQNQSYQDHNFSNSASSSPKNYVHLPRSDSLRSHDGFQNYAVVSPPLPSKYATQNKKLTQNSKDKTEANEVDDSSKSSEDSNLSSFSTPVVTSNTQQNYVLENDITPPVNNEEFSNENTSNNDLKDFSQINTKHLPISEEVPNKKEDGNDVGDINVNGNVKVDKIDDKKITRDDSSNGNGDENKKKKSDKNSNTVNHHSENQNYSLKGILTPNLNALSSRSPSLSNDNSIFNDSLFFSKKPFVPSPLLNRPLSTSSRETSDFPILSPKVSGSVNTGVFRASSEFSATPPPTYAPPRAPSITDLSSSEKLDTLWTDLNGNNNNSIPVSRASAFNPYGSGVTHSFSANNLLSTSNSIGHFSTDFSSSFIKDNSSHKSELGSHYKEPHFTSKDLSELPTNKYMSEHTYSVLSSSMPNVSREPSRSSFEEYMENRYSTMRLSRERSASPVLSSEGFGGHETLEKDSATQGFTNKDKSNNIQHSLRDDIKFDKEITNYEDNSTQRAKSIDETEIFNEDLDINEDEDFEEYENENNNENVNEYDYEEKTEMDRNQKRNENKNGNENESMEDDFEEVQSKNDFQKVKTIDEYKPWNKNDFNEVFDKEDLEDVDEDNFEDNFEDIQNKEFEVAHVDFEDKQDDDFYNVQGKNFGSVQNKYDLKEINNKSENDQKQIDNKLLNKTKKESTTEILEHNNKDHNVDSAKKVPESKEIENINNVAKHTTFAPTLNNFDGYQDDLKETYLSSMNNGSVTPPTPDEVKTLDDNSNNSSVSNSPETNNEKSLYDDATYLDKSRLNDFQREKANSKLANDLKEVKEVEYRLTRLSMQLNMLLQELMFDK